MLMSSLSLLLPEALVKCGWPCSLRSRSCWPAQPAQAARLKGLVLAQKNPEAYRPTVAKTLADLAALELQGHRLEAAQDALRLYEACAQQEAEALSPGLARAKELLARVHGAPAP